MKKLKKWPWKAAQPTQSTGKAEASPTPPQQQPPDQSSSWYRSIYDTPLSAFENCLLNDNLSALIISGFPDPVELSRAWSNILTEYTEQVSTAEYKLYLNLWKEVELLRVKYKMINVLIAALRKNESPYFAAELNGFLRTNYKFNPNNLGEYFAELDKCERRSKALKVQLDLKEIEFEAVKKKVNAGEGEALDKGYFTGVLIILSKHNQYRITKDIFVSEYCEYLKQFNAYCDEMNKQIKKK